MRRCLNCNSTDVDVDWYCPTCGVSPATLPDHISFVHARGETNDGFEGGFFERLASVEPGFWWFEARNALVVWALKKWFAQARSFLEVGCGTGFVVSRIAQEFPRVTTSASEIFAEAMPFVSRRSASTALFQFDACDVPFRAEFDLIGAFDVIEHIEDDHRAVFEMRRALRPGGGLIVTVPQHQFLWTAADEFAHHKRRYSRRSLRALLESAGFSVVAMRSFVSLLMPALLISRLALRRSRDYDPSAEFAISPTMNKILASIMAIERAMIANRASFPFGGSLLAVAHSKTASPSPERP